MRVVVAPVAVLTERTRQLPVSITKMLPAPSQDAVTGEAKRAAAPVSASTTAATPPPASVVVAPEATSTARTRWPPVSATYSTSNVAPLSAMPLGELKPAAAPTPSTLLEAPLPARVTVCAVAGPPLVMKRTRWLSVSAK